MSDPRPGGRRLPVFIEAGQKRVFASAVDWPGWSRSGKDEAAALSALVAFGPRYADAVGSAGSALRIPATVADVEVAGRLQGNTGTDFGVPTLGPAADDQPISASELEHWITLLKASWVAFDRIAAGAVGIELRKGPRGGGRDLDAVTRHVFEAEVAYAGQMRSQFRPKPDTEIAAAMPAAREAFVEAVRARARGDPLPESRRTSKVWSPRYAIRRSAWHVLDHAWEIEDRAQR